MTISKWIDLKRSAQCHFVDYKLYFHFLLNFSYFPFVRYIFRAFKDKTKTTKSLQLTDYDDAHFKLLPFLNELSDNFLLGLDMMNFQMSFKRSLIFCIFIEIKPVKGIKKCHVRFFFAHGQQVFIIAVFHSYLISIFYNKFFILAISHSLSITIIFLQFVTQNKQFTCFSDSHWFSIIWIKRQGRRHGNTVADSWVGAVMHKPHAIFVTDRQTSLQSRVPATKNK